jgi:hypothetical protein
MLPLHASVHSGMHVHVQLDIDASDHSSPFPSTWYTLSYFPQMLTHALLLHCSRAGCCAGWVKDLV